MIYYQYEINEEGIIVGIQSGDEPFEERNISLEKIQTIIFGVTTEEELLSEVSEEELLEE